MERFKCLLEPEPKFHAGNKCIVDVADHSLHNLRVGNDGTLGIITEVAVSLIKPPQNRSRPGKDQPLETTRRH